MSHYPNRGTQDEAKFRGVILSKDPGDGLKVDHTNPSHGWMDLKGIIRRDTAVNAPSFSTFVGGIKAWQFGNSDEVFIEFHLPHDYAPGTDIYIHAHWAQSVVDTGGAGGSPGQAKWFFEHSYAKGHDGGAFPSTKTVTVVQGASSTLRQHLVAEVQLSAGTPNGSQIDTDDLEPDGILMVRTYRDASDAQDTLDQDPFLLHVDVHYQSTGMATKNRAPNFYT